MRINVAYALLQAFYWCAYCSYFSYLAAYLLDRGYPQATVALAITMLAAIGAVVPFLSGYVVDFRIPIRGFVAGVMVLAVPAAFLLRFSVGSIPLAFLSIACLGVLERSQSSVIDSWAGKLHARGHALRYGPTRAVASLGFALTAFLLGRLFARVGLDALFFVHAAFAALAVAAALWLPGVPVASTSDDGHLPLRAAAGLLVRTPRFRILVASILLASFGTVGNVTFLPLLIQRLGGTSADLGACLALMAGSETVLLLLYPRLSRRTSAERLLYVAFFFQALRVLSAALSPSLPVLLATQVLQAFAFGLYLPALLQYIGQISEPRMLSTATTLAIALGDGVGGLLGSAAGSAVVAASGIRAAYFVFAGVTTAGFLLFAIGQPAVVRREIAAPGESP